MEREQQGNVHPPTGRSPSSDATPESAAAEAAHVDSPPPDAEPRAVPEEEVEGRHLLELWSDREEIHALPEILRPAEGIVAVGSGTVVKSARLAQSNWLVVLTDRRLLCIKGRHSATRKVIDMPVSAIRGVESKGIFRKTLSLDTGYGTLRISGMKKNVAGEMVEGLTALMGAYSDDGGGTKAIPRADLSKAGTGGGHTHEELQSLEANVDQLEETVGKLTERMAFLEELVRSNVAGQPDGGAG